jgi:hypothetical protein
MTAIRTRQRFARTLAVALITLLLHGCGGAPGLVRVDEPVRVQRIFEVRSPIEWARYRGYNFETWTVDGVALNRLLFVTNIRERHHVFGLGRATRWSPDGAFYRRDMNASELEEIIVDGLAELGAANVESSNLRPQSLGTLTGFRFDFRFQGVDGLIYQGTAIAVERRKFLNVVAYMAPAEYYYPRDREAVEALLRNLVARP